MKKNTNKIVMILLIIVVGILTISYKVYELKKNKNINSNIQTNVTSKVDSNENTNNNTASTSSSSNEKIENKTESNNKAASTTSTQSEQASSVKEQDKNVDRSKTVDINKVEEIISKKLPKGVITDLEFKNDSKNPYYNVTVISDNTKYKFSIFLKDGSIKEIEKKKIKINS